MSDRLSAADVAFLYLEGPTTPQHVGGLAVFTAPAGFDYDRLVRLIDERIALAPRYRQKLRPVPGNLANPVWVDDADFDLNYHVRRSALPRPGTEAELLEFCGRIQSRGLDRSRPLWEMYLVEGLAGGRVAIVTKTHPSMVDGTGADGGVDITEVLFDESPEPRRTVAAQWRPRRAPSSVRLVAEAGCGLLRSPRTLADTVRLTTREARSTNGWLTASVGGLAEALVGTVNRSNRPSRRSPLRAELGQHRRIAIARAGLDDFRQIRAWRSGTVHDAILAVVAGALRAWLAARGEPLAPTTTVRAMVPVGVHGPDRAGWTRSSRVAALLIDLPVGEPDPVRRLTRVQYAMAAHSASEPVGADALVGLSGFAPPTLHSLSARAAHGLTRRMYDIAVTNVPGPQLPLYAAGAQLAEMFPIMPLTDGHALSIGLTSYDGRVCFGVNADRNAVPDVDEVGNLLAVALAELMAACRPADIEPGRRRRRRHEPQS
ncbi:MAG TPA: wax ester/triacylglycerol synthase family O-acyltransferase [Jatrophihabitans sp.]